jgi:phenylacetate-coenzyme A ligase PaaK-like adenylate-forming protein
MEEVWLAMVHGSVPGELRTAIDLVRAKREGAAALARRQESRLAALTAQARARSRFYQRHYSGIPLQRVGLGELPPVTKPELMGAFEDWVTDPRLTREGLEQFVADPALLGLPYLGEYFVCSSSGTTGHPGLFVYDRTAITVMRAMVIARIDLGWLTAADWLRLTSRRFRWAAVVGTGGHFTGAGWLEAERRRSAWRARSYRLFSVQRPLRELAAALEAFDPGVITAYPSALQQLGEEQRAGRLHLRPVLVETGGESTSPDARAGMAAAFGCQIHDTYAASECPWLALDCAHGWLHVNTDWAVLEPVDQDYRSTPPGEPSYTVLVTNLANRVQPIIRYDLGDSVLARPDPCPCGNPLPAIRVAGRSDDVLCLRRSDGQNVRLLPLAIGSVVDTTRGVHRSQLIQTDPAAIRVRLEPETNADVERMWRDALANLHAFLADQGLEGVDLLRADELPTQNTRSGKFRQVIALNRSEPVGG